MGWWSDWLRRVSALSRLKRFDAEMDSDMEFHVEMLAAEYRERGHSAEEARLLARRQFGNQTSLRETSREVWGWGWFEHLVQDACYGLRVLAKNPGFTATAVATLALGIGANTLVFSIVDTIVVRAFPYPEPERLYFIYTTRAGRATGSMPSLHNFLAWQAGNDVFEEMGAWLPTFYDLRGSDYPEQLHGHRATASFFRTLGVHPQLGRLFLPEEERSGHDRVVLLSERIWRSRFAADPKIAGSTILLAQNSQEYERFLVAGVLPRSVDLGFGAHGDIWGVLAKDGDEAQPPKSYRGELHALARLKRDVTLAQAEHGMRALSSGLAEQYPETNKGLGVALVNFHQQKTGYHRDSLLSLMGAVAFVLLLACVNVAHMVLARGADRQREMTIRAAVGAGRWRLFRQLLTESVLLSLAGGVAGAALAIAGLGLTRSLVPAELSRADEIAIDGRVLAFTFSIAMLTGVVFGLVPAWRASGRSVRGLLQTGRGLSTPKQGLFRNALVVMEVAFGLILVTGAGLMLNSFVRLLRVDPGFEPRGVVSIDTWLPRARYGSESARREAIQVVLERLRMVPGVKQVGLTDFRPFNGLQNVAVYKPSDLGTRLVATKETVGGDYFAAMGTRLTAGRLFNRYDSGNAAKVVIVSGSAAKAFWPGETALGQEIRIMRGKVGETWRVVGVVQDVRHMDLHLPPQRSIYVPMEQEPPYHLEVVVRAQEGVPALSLAPSPPEAIGLGGHRIVGKQRGHDGCRGRVPIGHSAISRDGALCFRPPCDGANGNWKSTA